MIVQSKSPGTLGSPNSIRNIGFMPYKRTVTTKVIELLVLRKINPHILHKIASKKNLIEHKNKNQHQQGKPSQHRLVSKVLKISPLFGFNKVFRGLRPQVQPHMSAISHNIKDRNDTVTKSQPQFKTLLVR